MATPTCAGGAALVRQYFMEGYHHAGVKNVDMGIVPPASLIKAMMIHSGIPMMSFNMVCHVPELKMYKYDMCIYACMSLLFRVHGVQRTSSYDDTKSK